MVFFIQNSKIQEQIQRKTPSYFCLQDPRCSPRQYIVSFLVYFYRIFYAYTRKYVQII